MAKRKYFAPLVRCGCPRIYKYKNTGVLFDRCTCVLVSPKTGTRGRYLAPRGKYNLMVTSAKDPLFAGVVPFKKIPVSPKSRRQK